MIRSVLFVICLISVQAVDVRALPAFPGAEGAGAEALGGRGGDVYHVTNLNDDGPGSLRWGIDEADGPRTILFKVSGNIHLNDALKIDQPYLTIAGQSAPGDGIALIGDTVSVQNAHDIVVRYIRARAGDINCPDFEDDAFHMVSASNVVIDHVSASWSVDECLSVTHSDKVTVQWCVIAESLREACHDKGSHGYGSLLRYGDGELTFHHNLYSSHVSRNPRLGDSIKLDFVNNTIYNWGGTAGYNADDPGDFRQALNYVGNYLIAGPSTTGRLNVAFDSGVENAVNFEIFQSGNSIDSDKNGRLNGSDTGWSMFTATHTQRTERYPLPEVTAESSLAAHKLVLAFAGASLARDAADTRIVGNVRSQTGTIIDSQNEVGGYPVLNETTAPDDTDGDGIPDYWEAAMGWSPSIANNNHVNGDGYTDLEWYLNWLAAPHTVCDRNGFLDIDLAKFVGASDETAFSVTSGANGSTTLLADGRTARFEPTGDFSGIGDFSFTANDGSSRVGIGPIVVNVLIAADTEPVESPDLRYTIDGATGTIEFSWDGAFKLQHQSNRTMGIGSAWTDYPDGDASPVVVPIDGGVSNARYFRLKR